MIHIRSSYIIHCSATLVLMAVFIACAGRKYSETAFESVPLRYATNLTCERGEGYSVWTLRNPWDTTQVLHRYILQHDTLAQPQFSHLNEQTSLIPVPVCHAGVATAVHCGLLDELGVASAIAGVCEKQYIDLPAVTEGLAVGRIADFGNGMNPNIERIMEVVPDVLLLTPFEHSGGYGRVERLGIPIVECAEYMEVSPLARAEWIHFYGELFGVADKADSIFNAVATNYLFLKQSVADVMPDSVFDANSPIKHAHLTSQEISARAFSPDTSRIVTCSRPRLLTEMLYGGQWFVPCGQSTMGMMFADAGADYIFRNRPGSGSTALSFETVLDEAQDADIWLLKYNSLQPLTYSQLARDYQPYTRFRAFRQRHIYGCDLARNHFYEETPFHPDRLLRDLVIILHPELMPDEELRYYQPLKE